MSESSKNLVNITDFSKKTRPTGVLKMFKMIMGQYGDESDEESYLPESFINETVDFE